ncbi:hypothetical protein MLAC_36150 [Mycobacterium lacus]|uniref:Uncharacterized protein n=1 Tax=Mycobacterium lacus TaxID=169765 RepID=A0A7I7NR90_9MYCO|nr:hypothetical protein MLAC_36150 [Mycobacterium lacus]
MTKRATRSATATPNTTSICGSPSAGYPTTSNVPASLHFDTVGSIRHSGARFPYERSVAGTPISGDSHSGTHSHGHVIRTENMFATEQRNGSGRGFPHGSSEPAAAATDFDPWGAW